MGSIVAESSSGKAVGFIVCTRVGSKLGFVDGCCDERILAGFSLGRLVGSKLVVGNKLVAGSAE